MDYLVTYIYDSHYARTHDRHTLYTTDHINDQNIQSQ